MENQFKILYTLEVILGSDHPLSIEQVRKETGFHERQTQRHLSVLSSRGFVRRIGKSDSQGYSYSKVLPSSAG